MTLHFQSLIAAPAVKGIAEHTPEWFYQLYTFAFGEVEFFRFGVVAGAVVVHAGHEGVAGVEGRGVAGVVIVPLD